MPHFILILRIARQILHQQSFLLKDSPYKREHHEEEREESPPRAERKSRADEKNKASHIHRVTHECVESGRDDFLVGIDLDSCRGKGIFLVQNKYDEKSNCNKNVSRYR